MDTLTIASFDIGKHNFAFCIERVDMNHRGATFKDVCLNGTITHLVKTDLIPSEKNVDPASTFFTFMDKNKTLWDGCNIFVIEQQIKANYYALRLSYYLEAYLKLNYANFKMVSTFSSRSKTKLFEKHFMVSECGSKLARKKLCIQQAKQILMDRGDHKHLAMVNNEPKQDDLCDVICQLQAYKWSKMVKR